MINIFFLTAFRLLFAFFMIVNIFKPIPEITIIGITCICIYMEFIFKE